jgi:hypothetical protein
MNQQELESAARELTDLATRMYSDDSDPSLKVPRGGKNVA